MRVARLAARERHTRARRVGWWRAGGESGPVAVRVALARVWWNSGSRAEMRTCMERRKRDRTRHTIARVSMSHTPRNSESRPTYQGSGARQGHGPSPWAGYHSQPVSNTLWIITLPRGGVAVVVGGYDAYDLPSAQRGVSAGWGIFSSLRRAKFSSRALRRTHLQLYIHTAVCSRYDPNARSSIMGELVGARPQCSHTPRQPRKRGSVSKSRTSPFPSCVPRGCVDQHAHLHTSPLLHTTSSLHSCSGALAARAPVPISRTAWRSTASPCRLAPSWSWRVGERVCRAARARVDLHLRLA